MIWSLRLLVGALPSHTESPQDLLRSASALWITDILVLHHGTGDLMRLAHAPVNCAASAPMEPFCFLE
jgi:hypothetical protein